MEPVRQKLTQEEKAHLSNLWEDKDILHSLNSALSHQQLILAQQGVGDTTDFNQVMFLRGQIEGLKWMINFLQYNYRERKKFQEANRQAQGETSTSQ